MTDSMNDAISMSVTLGPELLPLAEEVLAVG
jgi:hypothetical protein